MASKVKTMQEAIAMIKDGDMVAVSGFVGAVQPEGKQGCGAE